MDVESVLRARNKISQGAFSNEANWDAELHAPLGEWASHYYRDRVCLLERQADAFFGKPFSQQDFLNLYKSVFLEYEFFDQFDAFGYNSWNKEFEKNAPEIRRLQPLVSNLLDYAENLDGVFVLGYNRFKKDGKKVFVDTTGGWQETSLAKALSFAFNCLEGNTFDVRPKGMLVLEGFTRTSQVKPLFLDAIPKLSSCSDPCFSTHARAITGFEKSIPEGQRVYLFRDALSTLFTELIDNPSSKSKGVLIGRYMFHGRNKGEHLYNKVYCAYYSALNETGGRSFDEFREEFCRKISNLIKEDEEFASVCKRIFDYLSSEGIPDRQKTIFIDTGYNATFPLLSIAVLKHFSKTALPGMDVFIMAPFPWLKDVLRGRYYSPDSTHVRELESSAIAEIFSYAGEFKGNQPVLKPASREILEKAETEMATIKFISLKGVFP